MTGGLEDFSRFVRRWLPVVIWMFLILVASTDLGSLGMSRRLLNPIFLWFDPRMTPHDLYGANIVFRKASHVIEFAILAILVWRTRDLLKNPWSGSCSLRLAGMVMAVCAFFAVSTELVQYASRNRAASPWDAAINLGGSGLGLAVVFLVKWARQPRHVLKKPRILIASGVNLENAEDTTVLSDIWETVAEARPDILVVLGPVGPVERASEWLALLKETAAPSRVIIHPESPAWQTAADAAGLSSLTSANVELPGLTLAGGIGSIIVTPAPSGTPLVFHTDSAPRNTGGLRQIPLGGAPPGPHFALYDAATGTASSVFSAAAGRGL